MRCKLCDLPHKNTSRYKFWVEYQVCRICYPILDIYLKFKLLERIFGGIELVFFDYGNSTNYFKQGIRTL